jgi:hypothetical protein
MLFGYLLEEKVTFFSPASTLTTDKSIQSNLSQQAPVKVTQPSMLTKEESVGLNFIFSNNNHPKNELFNNLLI